MKKFFIALFCLFASSLVFAQSIDVLEQRYVAASQRLEQTKTALTQAKQGAQFNAALAEYKQAEQDFRIAENNYLNASQSAAYVPQTTQNGVQTVPARNSSAVYQYSAPDYSANATNYYEPPRKRNTPNGSTSVFLQINKNLASNLTWEWEDDWRTYEEDMGSEGYSFGGEIHHYVGSDDFAIGLGGGISHGVIEDVDPTNFYFSLNAMLPFSHSPNNRNYFVANMGLGYGYIHKKFVYASTGDKLKYTGLVFLKMQLGLEFSRFNMFLGFAANTLAMEFDDGYITDASATYGYFYAGAGIRI